MTRRICILGSAPSSRDLAPFDDKDVEFWTLAQRVEKRADRVFEIHVPEQSPLLKAKKRYGVL
jgi:hypothetical protein